MAMRTLHMILHSTYYRYLASRRYILLLGLSSGPNSKVGEDLRSTGLQFQGNKYCKLILSVLPCCLQCFLLPQDRCQDRCQDSNVLWGSNALECSVYRYAYASRVVTAVTMPFECVTVRSHRLCVQRLLSPVTAPFFLSLVRVPLCTYGERTMNTSSFSPYNMPFVTT
jgi:hypothetical protein